MKYRPLVFSFVVLTYKNAKFTLAQGHINEWKDNENRVLD